MSRTTIYLDYNATSPVRECVREACLSAMDLPLNPSSVHRYGAEAKKRLEAARRSIANSVAAFPNEVIFTASGSEANALALRGFQGRPIITSSIEHASVQKTASLMGAATTPVDSQGVVELAALDAMLAALGTPALVSIILANNETGVIQPVREIAEIVHQRGGYLHCDAVQAFGKIPLDMGLMGVDMMTISGHKVGGMVGVAALILRNDIAITPLIYGGRQETGRRAGTEALPLIAGFAALAEQVTDTRESSAIRTLRDRFEQRVCKHLPKEYIMSHGAERLANTSMIVMPKVTSETQLIQFDLQGFCVSAGSACASGRIEPSHVLRAMGVAEDSAACALRISLGWASIEAEIDAFADAWEKLYQTLGLAQQQATA
jgi:cysteine desulfurase